jgi:hypothetical protein
MNITNQLVTPKAPRWYDQQGNPLYEVPCKGKPGTMRDFTLADARKMDPKPLVSVTSVLQVLAKPELEAWKIENAIIAALTLPRQKESAELWMSRAFGLNSQELLDWAYSNPPRFLDSEEVFAEKVVKDMDSEVNAAADFGRTIHHAIEAHLTGDIATIQTLPESVMPWLDEFIKWQEGKLLAVYATEYVVVNKEVGYAGRMDLHGEINGIGEVVCDFKSQRIKNGKPSFYSDWALQLAAYEKALGFHAALMSVVIDSQKPSPPIVKVWEDPQKHYEAFLNALALWKYLKNYP